MRVPEAILGKHSPQCCVRWFRAGHGEHGWSCMEVYSGLLLGGPGHDLVKAESHHHKPMPAPKGQARLGRLQRLLCCQGALHLGDISPLVFQALRSLIQLLMSQSVGMLAGTARMQEGEVRSPAANHRSFSDRGAFCNLCRGAASSTASLLGQTLAGCAECASPEAVIPGDSPGPGESSQMDPFLEGQTSDQPDVAG